jgi:hypothetical protein
MPVAAIAARSNIASKASLSTSISQRAHELLSVERFPEMA